MQVLVAGLAEIRAERVDHYVESFEILTGQFENVFGDDR
jgi:hypothetical protein